MEEIPFPWKCNISISLHLLVLKLWEATGAPGVNPRRQSVLIWELITGASCHMANTILVLGKQQGSRIVICRGVQMIQCTVRNECYVPVPLTEHRLQHDLTNQSKFRLYKEDQTLFLSALSSLASCTCSVSRLLQYGLSASALVTSPLKRGGETPVRSPRHPPPLYPIDCSTSCLIPLLSLLWSRADILPSQHHHIQSLKALIRS